MSDHEAVLAAPTRRIVKWPDLLIDLEADRRVMADVMEPSRSPYDSSGHRIVTALYPMGGRSAVVTNYQLTRQAVPRRCSMLSSSHSARGDSMTEIPAVWTNYSEGRRPWLNSSG
jgi:hypothetical protein